MGRCIYQHIGYALCISATALLYGSDGSDLSTSCKVVGLLKGHGKHEAEEHHAALHQQKQEFKENLHPEVLYFTDRLDQLVELAVFMVTSGPLDIFIGLTQQVQSDDADCAWCLSERIILKGYTDNQKEYQNLVKTKTKITVCQNCYSKKLYSPIAFDGNVECGDDKQERCLACEYSRSNEQVYVNRWGTVTEEALKQLKSSAYFNICTKSHVYNISIEEGGEDPLFKDNAKTVIQEYVEHLVKRTNQLSNDKIDLKECRSQKLQDLLNAYANHLGEVSEQLSPRAEFKCLKERKGKIGIEGFLNRKQFIEKLYSALCISKEQVEKMIPNAL